METKTLKAHELEPGMTIYYCDAPRNQKKDSFRSAIVKEIYKHHIVVKTIPDKTSAETIPESIGCKASVILPEKLSAATALAKNPEIVTPT